MRDVTETRFDYDGPDALLPAVTAAIEKVVDPEVGLNIVDVGLVYHVRIAQGRLDVVITMTSAACPVADVIVQDIENELDRAMPADLKIHVELVWEPPWDPSRMSSRAKAAMGW